MVIKMSRTELGYTVTTAESGRKVCGIHKRSRMELRFAIRTAKSESTLCAMREKEHTRAQMLVDDCCDWEKGEWNT